MATTLNILVTGGAGFIGACTAALLLKAGHSVTVADKTPREKAWRLAALPASGALRYECIDLCDRDAMMALFTAPRFDAIIHLAAMVSVCECEANENACFENNLEVTRHLAAHALRTGVKRFVFASSAAVYGDSDALPLREDTPTRPISHYGRSKLMSEEVLQGHNHAMTVTALRYFNVFGPRQEETAYAGVMTHFFKSSLERRAHGIHGDGGQTRDFVFVGDVARLNAFFCEHPKAGVFNVCTGREVSVNDISALIAREMDHAHQPVYGPRKCGDIYRSVGEPARLAAMVPDWPFTSMEDGLSQTAAYFQKC